jgi:hypothetical protein
MQTGVGPKGVAGMGRAYEDLLRDSGITDRADPATETVAKEIVRVAKGGLRDPAEIRAQVLVLRRTDPDGADESS